MKNMYKNIYKVNLNELEIDFIIIAIGAKIRELETDSVFMNVAEEYKRIKEMLENLKAETA